MAHKAKIKGEFPRSVTRESRAPRTVALEHEYQILYQQAPSSGDPIFISVVRNANETHLPPIDASRQKHFLIYVELSKVALFKR
jgi:hypothetical protein